MRRIAVLLVLSASFAACSAAPIDVVPLRASGPGDGGSETIEHHEVQTMGGDYYIQAIVENSTSDVCPFAISALGETITGDVAPGDRSIETRDVVAPMGTAPVLVSSACSWTVTVAASR